MNSKAQVVTQNSLEGLIGNHPSDHPMIVFADTTWTYGQICTRAAQFASVMERAGLQHGDAIGLMLPNHPDWLAIAYACARIGVATVSMNPRLGPKEVADLLRRSGSVGIVIDSAHRNGAIADTLQATPLETLANVRLVLDLAPNKSASLINTHTISLTDQRTDAQAKSVGCADDICHIVPTSGTTSLPKLAAHRQGTLAKHFTDAAAATGITSDSRVYLPLPLCGAYAYTIAQACLAGGATLLLEAEFDIETTCQRLAEDGVTHMFGTNDMAMRILETAKGDIPFPTLQMYGHANFTPGLTELPALAEAHGMRLRGCYGMTELMAMFAVQPADLSLQRRDEAGGRPVCAQAKVRIVRLDDQSTADPGEVGLIEVRTPNHFSAYLGDPETTANAMTEDGFFRTGDLGSLHSDGCVHFVARQTDVLRIGGYLVSPIEIEAHILATAPVSACQVVAANTPQGVRPVAFVIMKGDASLDEAKIIADCKAALAIYKVPVKIVAMSVFPTIDGPNGAKVKKTELRVHAENLLVGKSA